MTWVPVLNDVAEEMFVNLEHVSKVYKFQNNTYWAAIKNSASYEISKETYDEILGRDS